MPLALKPDAPSIERAVAILESRWNTASVEDFRDQPQTHFLRP